MISNILFTWHAQPRPIDRATYCEMENKPMTAIHPNLAAALEATNAASRAAAMERAELEAEIERLRAALQEILNHSDYRTGAYPDQVCDMRQIAREALK